MIVLFFVLRYKNILIIQYPEKTTGLPREKWMSALSFRNFQKGHQINYQIDHHQNGHQIDNRSGNRFSNRSGGNRFSDRSDNRSGN